MTDSQNKEKVEPALGRGNFQTVLKAIVERSDTRAGRTFDLVIQGLIILSILSFSVETLPNLSAKVQATLYLIETVTVAAFTAEYLARLWVADRRIRFVVSFYGLIDLIAIAPFYLSTGVDLRAVRALRLLRLFKLFRYSRSINLFRRAFHLIRDELALFGATALLVLYVAAVGIYFFEHDAQPEKFGSVFHSLWWAVTTLTTVGYGDAYPVTLGGRIFTFFVLAIGLAIVAVPTGLISAALTRARHAPEDLE